LILSEQGWRVALPNTEDPFPERSEDNIQALVDADQSLFPGTDSHQYKYEHPRATSWRKNDNQPCYNCGKSTLLASPLYIFLFTYKCDSSSFQLQ
jgi:hypothetical protein